MPRVVRNDGAVEEVVLPLNVKRLVETDPALGHGETITVGPFAMEGYGKITVLVDADQDGAFDITEHATDTGAAVKTPVTAQATVGSTYYEGTPTGIGQPYCAVAWTNGHVTDDADVTVTVLLEGSAGNAEVVPYDSSAVELFSDTNPGSVQLRTAAGATLGTAADPLPVGLTTAAGAAIGEAAAAPLFGELVNSSAAELFTTTTPGQVEALITDGAGTAVSQSVSADYATITVWEVAAQAVTQAATYTGTGRDCLYMKDIAVSAHATQASSADGCLVQESNDNSTWYTLSKCTLAANTNTILYAGPRTRRYVRIVYTEANAGAATLNTSISASPQ